MPPSAEWLLASSIKRCQASSSITWAHHLPLPSNMSRTWQTCKHTLCEKRRCCSHKYGTSSQRFGPNQCLHRMPHYMQSEHLSPAPQQEPTNPHHDTETSTITPKMCAVPCQHNTTHIQTARRHVSSETGRTGGRERGITTAKKDTKSKSTRTHRPHQLVSHCGKPISLGSFSPPGSVAVERMDTSPHTLLPSSELLIGR